MGIRELRQNLSQYVTRVKAGEPFLVTERNQPVARLTPLEDDDPIARLVAAGKVRLAAGDILEVTPIFSKGESEDVRAAYEEQRGERLP